MKKLIIAALIAVSVATSAFADVTVSSIVKNRFKSDFANATNVTWTVGSNFTKASFELEGERMEAFYGYDGKTVAVSKHVDFNSLPKDAVKAINKQYSPKTYILKECIEMTNADEETLFYVSYVAENKEKIILQVTVSGTVEVFKRDKIK